MSLLTEREARELLQKVLKFSKAESCEVNIGGNTGGNIRYARNTVSTAGVTEDANVVVQATYGKRSGVATGNEYNDAALERVVRRAEELAQLAPEDPEFMPNLGPQEYLKVDAWADATANITPEYRADVAGASILPAKAKGCTAAGFEQDQAGWSAMANSKGLFAYHRQTNLNFSVTMRTDDGTGSGYAARDYDDSSKFDARTTSEIAVEKAVLSKDARAIEPGKYTVILEPEAFIDLLQPLGFAFNARNADEGRSPMSKPGGGTKLGEQLVDPQINIRSDPTNPEVPTSPWLGDGRPAEKTAWIENGVVKNLSYSRYWAEKQGKHATPFPSNLIMAGGSASIDDLIKDTARGVLVTRLWYIRFVDPQTLLLTGLTRDGTFFVENGKVKHAVKNFRFNESPIIMLNNVEAIGKPERVRGNLIPPIRVRDFTFSSLSDAV